MYPSLAIVICMDTYYNGQRRMHIKMAKEGYILQWPKKDAYYNGQRRIHITMAKE
jgi:hypothetical protein